MAAHRPWRTPILVAALALAAGACGQGADQEAQDPTGPDPAPSSTTLIPATSAAPAGPSTQAELDRIAVELDRVARLREPVALAAADGGSTHPDRVARLVLINCAVTLPPQVRREMQAAVQTLQDPLPVAFVRELHASVAHVPLPGPVLERLVAQSLKAPARVWKSALEGLLGFDDAAELGRIVAPTLLLWGERDGMFSREEQERLAAVIPGTRLQVVPETGHSPHLERPERVVDDLDAFMRAA